MVAHLRLEYTIYGGRIQESIKVLFYTHFLEANNMNAEPKCFLQFSFLAGILHQFHKHVSLMQ